MMTMALKLQLRVRGLWPAAISIIYVNSIHSSPFLQYHNHKPFPSTPLNMPPPPKPVFTSPYAYGIRNSSHVNSICPSRKIAYFEKRAEVTNLSEDEYQKYISELQERSGFPVEDSEFGSIKDAVNAFSKLMDCWGAQDATLSMLGETPVMINNWDLFDIDPVNKILHSCCHFKGFDNAYAVLGGTIKSGLVPNFDTYVILVRGFLKHGYYFADGLCGKLLQWGEIGLDVVTYEAITNGLHAMALESVEYLIGYDNLIYRYCAESNMKQALCLFDKMVCHGWIPLTETCYNVLHGLCQSGDLVEAMLFFRMIEERQYMMHNYEAYKILINGLCKYQFLHEAMEYFYEMERFYSCTPNIDIYNTLISAHWRNNVTYRAKALIDDIYIKCLRPDSDSYTLMFEILSEEGLMDKAIKKLEEMESHGCSPDDLNCNTVLYGCLENTKYSEACAMVAKMIDRGFLLDTRNASMLSYLKSTKVSDPSLLALLALSNNVLPHDSIARSE